MIELNSKTQQETSVSKKFVSNPTMKQYWPLLVAMVREGILKPTDVYNIVRDVKKTPRRDYQEWEIEDDFPWD